MLPAVAFLWLVAAACSSGCRAQGSRAEDPEPAGLTPAADGSLRIVGVVVENDHGCVQDLACFLRVETEGQEVLVIYNEGESSEPCLNEKAAKIGFEVEKGQRIAAHGLYRREGATVIVSTCPSTAYSIKVLQPGDASES